MQIEIDEFQSHVFIRKLSQIKEYIQFHNGFQKLEKLMNKIIKRSESAGPKKVYGEKTGKRIKVGYLSEQQSIIQEYYSCLSYYEQLQEIYQYIDINHFEQVENS